MSDVHLQSETFCCPERTCCDTGRDSVTLSVRGKMKALYIKDGGGGMYRHWMYSLIDLSFFIILSVTLFSSFIMVLIYLL